MLVSAAASGPAHGARLHSLPQQALAVPWPTETWPSTPLEPSVDAQAVRALLDRAFANEEEASPPGTRATIIIHRGLLVAERYGAGFGPDRRFLSQSMAKTVTGALVGIAVGKGLLSLQQPAPVPEWQEAGNPRRAITLHHLMTMSSGLAFNESYFNPVVSDALPMLFGHARHDKGAYAARQPLIHDPGTHWSYASGTTNLISRIVKGAVGGTEAAYRTFMFKELFGPLGMRSAVPEFDESGTFVGSSWLHATARDWARFGLFMLRGGVWEGRAILPEGWVDYMRTPLDHEEYGVYGAQTWLNVGNPDKGIEPRIPNAPADMFMASGFRGQFVAMIPSKDLVIVRLGRTGYIDYPTVWRWIGDLAAQFPDVP